MDRSRDFARGLLHKARGDQFALSQLVDLPQAPVWILGFHAQQAIEKALKAVLASRSIEYPPTHNLVSLVALLRDKGIAMPPDSDDFAQLTPYGVAFRYDVEPEEEATIHLDRANLKAWVLKTVAWAEDMIETRPGSKV